METLEIIIASILAIAFGGGAIFSYKKKQEQES